MAILNSKYRMIILQLIGWSVILGTTLFWSVNPSFKTFDLMMFSLHVVPLILIYILNYTLIIPKLMFRDRVPGFIVVNLLLVILLMFLSYRINIGAVFEDLIPDIERLRARRNNPIFLARDLINYVTMIGLVSAVRLVERLRVNEEALRVAESARVKSELANLRSQINPHFLLNTLNNIYSLTVIDVEKAQKAIQELSRLLQYVLYDNTSDKVPLQKEINFIKNYVELMRIRLSSRVKLTVDFDVRDNTTTQIAPLIFISLIENAFKHGVSADEESFISIHFEDRISSGEIVMVITNSNNAKSGDSDKSGSGIGLEQVHRRLELQYPDNYKWDITNEKDIYKSELIITV